MAGRLIFVSGLSGAGKTTLIGAALKHVNGLEYLKTYTTRPRRDGEVQSHEYEFVSDEEYEKLRGKSADWDHTDYRGNKYGADVQAVKEMLASGRHVICSIAPDGLVLGDMKRRYDTEPLTIWIDTPAATANLRTDGDMDRAARHEDEFAHKLFMYTFMPTGQIEADCKEFSERVGRLLT